MNILLMMLRAPRPSRQDDMQAVAKPRWIRKGYDGLNRKPKHSMRAEL